MNKLEMDKKVIRKFNQLEKEMAEFLSPTTYLVDGEVFAFSISLIKEPVFFKKKLIEGEFVDIGSLNLSEFKTFIQEYNEDDKN